MRTQPHIHDTIVTVRRGRCLHHFHIFVKNHRLLPLNAAIAALAPGHQWRGDVLVMRAGTSVAGVVNMRNGDRRLADYAVRWYSSLNFIYSLGLSFYSASSSVYIKACGFIFREILSFRAVRFW